METDDWWKSIKHKKSFIEFSFHEIIITQIKVSVYYACVSL